jgi:hypothetical protein
MTKIKGITKSKNLVVNGNQGIEPDLLRFEKSGKNE